MWNNLLVVIIFVLQQIVVNSQINFASYPCARRQARIVGGQETRKHEMPFIVSLTRRGGHFCGASIIHERWLITAGHCICNGLNQIMKSTQIEGIVGLHSHKEFANTTHLTDFKPQRIYFKNIIPHPNYNCAKVNNDIALLELLQPIQFTTHIQPSCLALDNGIPVLEHDTAIVSGWGWTHENREEGDRSDLLRKASVKIWNNDLCEKSYHASGQINNFISDTQMCAGFKKGGIDACWADSGGPLMSSDNVLIGVVSTGIGCARPGLPGIYTRVSKYIEWIESVIHKN